MAATLPPLWGLTPSATEMFRGNNEPGAAGLILSKENEMDTSTGNIAEGIDNETHQPEGLATGQDCTAAEIPTPAGMSDALKQELRTKADRQAEANGGEVTDADRQASIGAYKRRIKFWNSAANWAREELTAGRVDLADAADLLAVCAERMEKISGTI